MLHDHQARLAPAGHAPFRGVLAGGLLLLLAATLSAQATGSIAGALKLSQLSGGFGGALDNNDRFGSATAFLGDVDGDGIADIAVAASHDDDGQSDSGAVWILFLNADGSVREQRKLSATQGGGPATLDAGDQLGWSLAALGDVDGDGVGDLAAGAPGDDDGQSGAGAVWILFLQRDGSVRESRKLSAVQGGFPGALAANDGFGSALAALGDLDGDGVGDLAVGAPGSDDGAAQAGAVWVVFLQADGSARGAQKLSATSGDFTGSLDPNDNFGAGLARLGALGTDPSVALAVGAPGDDEGATDAGAVWILRLTSAGSVASHTRLPATAGGLLPQKGDALGRALAAVPDVDGNGIDDLLAGAPGADIGSVKPGTLRVLFLQADGSALAGLVLSNSNGGLGAVLDGGDGFGTSVAAASGEPAAADEHARVWVGAWRDDDGGPDRGAAWSLQLLEAPQAPAFPQPSAALDGAAGQPALLFPAVSGVGDDFINEPVVVVPTTPNSMSLSEFQGEDSEFIEITVQPKIATGHQPIQAQTADFSGDGQPDIVIANHGSASVSLHVQLSTLGGESQLFAPQLEIPLLFDTAPVALQIGDVNGDTLQDVVVAGSGGITTLLGDGLGGLVPAAFVPVAFLSDLRLAFLNGDSHLDIVATSGAPATPPAPEIGFATVLLGDGSGSFTAGSVFAQGHAVASVLLANFDGQGALDALLAIHDRSGGAGGLPQGRIELFVGDGAGGFLPAPTPTGFAQPDADGVHPRWGAVADLDGNGLPDAVYTSNDSLAFAAGTFAQEQPPVSLSVLLADGAGGFTASALPTAYAGKGVAPLLADIAPPPFGDGAPDCVLVWTQDLLAGTGDPAQGSTAPATLLAALVGDGRGNLVDASPNQYLASEEPGDPTIDEIDGQAGFSASAAGPDILIPDLADGSVKILLGNGVGGIAATLSVPDVDPIDPRTLPAGGIWQGGPRSVVTTDFDADGQRDFVVSSRWDDLAGLFAPRAGFATFLGDGTGAFAPAQAFLLASPGEVQAGDVTGDGRPDVCATLLTGGGADALAIHRGVGLGQLAPVPLLVPAPAGRELTGGLALANVDGVPGAELITTARVTATGAGELLVVVREPGVFAAHSYALGGSWDDVRSLDVGDIDGDGLPDVAVGVADGRLFLARGGAGGGFTPLATTATAAALGGGALRLGHIDGDNVLDLVSSTITMQGALDQAFVRVLLGTGGGGFQVSTLPGLSSVGVGGTRRPALGDLDGNGAPDTVLVHGGTGTVSVLLNTLSTFVSTAPGKAGTGGIVPALGGQGFTTLGGSITLALDDALAGAPGLLQIGTGPSGGATSGLQAVAAELPILIAGPGPGSGTWSMSTHIPNDDRFVGLTVVLRILIADAGAGPPAPYGLSFSNELAFTILP